MIPTSHIGRFWRPALLAASLVCQPPAAAQNNTPAAKPALPLAEMQSLARVYELLQKQCATLTPGSQIMLGALKGMVKELDPEGGEYFTDEELKAFRNTTAQPDQGSVGVELRQKMPDKVELAPLWNGPAVTAGVQLHDQLVAVDGQPVAHLSTHQITGLLRGPVGSTARLSLLRDCQATPVELSVTRAVVTQPRPALDRPAPGLAVLRLPSSNERTLEDTASLLQREWRDKPFDKGLVLDLRGNPGGLLETYIGLAAIFLPADALVARTEGQSAEANHDYRANPESYARRPTSLSPLRQLPPELKTLPLVVLTDGATASGAEIVAAALKDHQRATLVGRRTYGRGSIQTVFPLGGGHGAVKLTTAHWVSPNGTRIHGTGLEPDVTVNDPDPAPALDAALRTLAAKR